MFPPLVQREASQTCVAITQNVCAEAVKDARNRMSETVKKAIIMQKEKFTEQRRMWKLEKKALKKKVKSMAEYLAPVGTAIKDIQNPDAKTAALEKENEDLRTKLAQKNDEVADLRRQLGALLTLSSKRLQAHAENTEDERAI